MADGAVEMEGISETGFPLESFSDLPPNFSQVSQGSPNRIPVSPPRSG
jgi:hypothetical protein